MTSQFTQLYESLLHRFFTEGVDAVFLRKKNMEATILKKTLNSSQTKAKLKQLSKDLILHLLNGNYKNILSKYFPSLVQYSNKSSDVNFKVKFEKELESNPISADTYKAFLKDIDDIIYELSSRNSGELNSLRYLRTNYLLSY